MTVHEFTERVKRLYNIDVCDLEDAEVFRSRDILVKKWPAFRENPSKFLLTCDDEVASRIWELTERRA